MADSFRQWIKTSFCKVAATFGLLERAGEALCSPLERLLGTREMFRNYWARPRYFVKTKFCLPHIANAAGFRANAAHNATKLIAGIEPQLDAAIKQMLDELKTKPFVKARKPTLSRDRRRGIVTASEK
jgi:hypothetical protein